MGGQLFGEALGRSASLESMRDQVDRRGIVDFVSILFHGFVDDVEDEESLGYDGVFNCEECPCPISIFGFVVGFVVGVEEVLSIMG